MTRSLRMRAAIATALAATALATVFAGSALAAPPANDNFANRTVIGPALPINNVAGTTVEATNEVGEPDHPGFGDGAVNSIWYEWVAPASGTIRIDACDSDQFIAVGVYTGNAVNALSTVSASGTCIAQFAAVNGTSYKIALDGDGSTGATSMDVFAITVPANDSLANAVALPSALPLSVGGNTLNSTLQPGEDEFETNPEGNFGSVWYTWTPNVSQSVRLDTCTSDGDSTITVYTGTTIGTLNALVSNDDGCASGNDLGSSLNLNATQGTAYRIAVGALCPGFCEGPFTLRITANPVTTPPIVDPTPPPVKPKKCKKGFKRVKKNGKVKCKKIKKKKK